MADDHHGTDPAESDDKHGPPHGYTDTGSHALPGGVTVAVDGLQLEASETRIKPRESHEWTYQIRNEEGTAIRRFQETHDQLAHLILIRRDLTRFQHLHPELAEDGTWSVEFTLPDPGVYRAFVDVLVDGRPTTLGTDLFASGSANYEEPPRSSRVATTNGYDIELSPENIPAEKDLTLEFGFSQDGGVPQLEPYLGALGHLVALRDGDLAYLHVHPEETDPEDGVVQFTVRFPTASRYRLFLQAKPDGELITTSFDVQAMER
ncbi:hypothetical protein [Halobellus salinisoli]|uniref:hypothetical protein n=1 Tax=Halobellus salinisoli TaxID=3108500 RepID=UPI00300807F5